MNNSVMKCCICYNEKSGEFITINDKKYHLCCIEQLQNNWNELKKWLQSLGLLTVVMKMQELEGNNE